MKRTMRNIEENKASRAEAPERKGTKAKKSKLRAKNNADNTAERKRRNAERIAPFKWQKGQSGNPGGRPKNDIAKAICQAVFEQNPELIYKGLVQQLKRGAGYVFQVASDRAYGKISDKLQVTTTEDMIARLRAGRKRAAAPKDRPRLAPSIEVPSLPEAASQPAEVAEVLDQPAPAESIPSGVRIRARNVF